MTKQRQSFVTFFFLFCVFCVSTVFLSGCSDVSTLSCSVPVDGPALDLRALSPAAKNGLITDSSTTAWFAFNSKDLATFVSQNPLFDAIEVTLRSSVPVDVMFAPVYTDDLTNQGKLVKQPATRANALITGVSGTVAIRMRMIPLQNPEIFAGFAVEALRSSVSDDLGTELGGNASYAEIISISFYQYETGWDTGSNAYWAGFGQEGGVRAYQEKGPVQLNQGERATFFFSSPADDIGTPILPRRSAFSAGSRTFGWRVSPEAHITHVYAEQLKELPTLITPERGTEHLTGIRISSSSDLQTDSHVPIPVDPHAMITWPQHAWRNPEREIFSWDRFPSILIFDTVDYAIQSRYFKRLAFFVEKAGYVGQLMNDRDIAHLHGYNAHDYQAESLAAFFTKAKREKFRLNRYEQELRNILIKNGIIVVGEDGYLPGTGAVLSFSRESASYLRYLFMTHEGFHGLYFIHEPFRDKMHQFYTAMDSRAVSFLETYFFVVDTLGYDHTDQFLMENECMAYTLQQPLNRVANYFSGTIKERFTRYGGPDDLAEYIEQTNAEDFVRLGRNLETYVFSRWGLAAGRVGLWYSKQD